MFDIGGPEVLELVLKVARGTGMNGFRGWYGFFICVCVEIDFDNFGLFISGEFLRFRFCEMFGLNR